MSIGLGSQRTVFISVKDTKLNEVTTDINGDFLVSGSTAGITSVEPKIKILHKCNYSGVYDLYKIPIFFRDASAERVSRFRRVKSHLENFPPKSTTSASSI